MHGIVMAGGNGSRLNPITLGVSKQLLPIYDKPLIFYSLSVLFLAGIRNLTIVCMSRDIEAFKMLFGEGERFGAEITYVTQDFPRGIAEGILLCEHFVKTSSVAMVLGDNFFWGQAFYEQLAAAKASISNDKGAHVFGYRVRNPEDFGVLELDNNEQVISLEEKPTKPASNIAATGLYFYDESALERTKSLVPSNRGELEITDLNLSYLNDKSLGCTVLGRGFAWLDTGSFQGLHDASVFVESIEGRQGLKIACLEEIALQNGWIEIRDLEASISNMGESSYRLYLEKLMGEFSHGN
ncbi:glucose-1-phosphate thymidylyltransferase RfbA [Alphaproteobacteria bacterium]|nr:glucose-1-phosphate thymidylyltransferase RfbA [Alphaproteobacteria bacterium]MDB2431933.1 glucose-1-phosphate thymidylyltransferase RfbA [Alphaproteobacteria bacterium]MDB2575104.1 glucose-1-phosphate thymidylyltransferase RfbA [Alphaproteobacteria bacterium]MDB2656030.1 glucose-1-phosphate thymidylyltransferase RfbA [Alphaproteobacteria bacterium]